MLANLRFHKGIIAGAPRKRLFDANLIVHRSVLGSPALGVMTGRQSMTGERISRRRLLRGTAGLIAGGMAYRVAGRSVRAAETTALNAVSRTIEVNGKA